MTAALNSDILKDLHSLSEKPDGFHCQVEPQFLYLPMDFYIAGLTIVKVPKQCGATNLYAKMKISFKESPLAHKPKNVCSRLAMNL